MIGLEFILKLIEEYSLEANQAIYLTLVYEGDTSKLIRYCAKVKDERQIVSRVIKGKRTRVSKESRLTVEEAQELHEKGLVDAEWDLDQEYNLIEVRLSSSFREWMDKNLGRKNYGPANEFWNEYPSANHGQGKVIPLKGVDIEEFKDRYSREITSEQHRKLMQIVKSNKATINVRIDGFVFGRNNSEPQWKAFENSAMSSLGSSNIKL